MKTLCYTCSHDDSVVARYQRSFGLYNQTCTGNLPAVRLHLLRPSSLLPCLASLHTTSTLYCSASCSSNYKNR
jgi:hypothetical protein